MQAKSLPRRSTREAGASSARVYLLVALILVGVVVALAVWQRGGSPDTTAAVPAAVPDRDPLPGGHDLPPSEDDPSGDDREAGVTPEEELEPILPQILRGRVSYGEDQPIERGALHAVLESGAALHTLVRDGTYRFEGALGPRVLLLYEIEGFARGTDSVTLRGPGEVTTHDIDFPAQPCVAVAVKSLARLRKISHYAISRLHAVATRAPPPNPLPLCLQGRHARFGVGRFGRPVELRNACSLEETLLGGVLLDAPGPVSLSLVFGHDVLDTKDFVTPPTKVEFEVTEEMAERVAELQTTVTLRLQDAPAGGRARLDLASSRGVWRSANAEGEIRIDDHGSAIGILVVEAPGKVTLQQLVQLSAGRTLELGTIALEPGADLRGRITRKSGDVGGGKIFVHADREGGVSVLPERVPFPFRRDGEFTVESLPSGDVMLVVATHEGDRVALPVSAAAAAGAGVTLELPETTACVLEKNPGSEHPNALCTVLDAAGHPLWSRVLAPGHVTMLRLAPGPYRVELRRHAQDTYALRSSPFEIVAGEPAHVAVP